jgi:translation initiation factor 2B subunit (eIF-2B alpha/beta/delta family)
VTNHIDPRLAARIAEIHANRTAGATELLEQALEVLADALALHIPAQPIADALAAAQPSMASLLNAGAAAVAAEQDPVAFDRFRQRLARAPGALIRNALDCFEDRGTPLRLVTISASRAVVLIVEALRARGEVHVSCAEGRPALEGRSLATKLAQTGIAVTLFTDAALGGALAGADAVLVGADAVTPHGVVNKVGTEMLAVTAARRGVPFYVAATRDKLLNAQLGARLSMRSGPPEDVWDAPPMGVGVRNPYFEEVPLDVITAVISDSAVIPGVLVAEACAG